MMFKKILVEDEVPKEEGKYIVFTKTTMGSVNVFQCKFHLDKKGKAVWGCNNQVVTHWLK